MRTWRIDRGGRTRKTWWAWTAPLGVAVAVAVIPAVWAALLPAARAETP